MAESFFSMLFYFIVWLVTLQDRYQGLSVDQQLLLKRVQKIGEVPLAEFSKEDIDDLKKLISSKVLSLRLACYRWGSELLVVSVCKQK